MTTILTSRRYRRIVGLEQKSQGMMARCRREVVLVVAKKKERRGP